MKAVTRQIADLVAGDTWSKRRRVIHWTLLFCACVISAALGAAIVAQDMTAVLNLAGSAFLLGGSTLTAYVFGANADDKDKRKHMAEPSNTSETPE